MTAPEPEPTAPSLLALQTKQLAAVREHCLGVGRAMGLPPTFFKAAEKTTTPDLVGQVLLGLRHANDQLVEVVATANRDIEDGRRREAALRAELIAGAGNAQRLTLNAERLSGPDKRRDG